MTRTTTGLGRPRSAKVADRREKAIRMLLESTPRPDIHAQLYPTSANPSADLAADVTRALKQRTADLDLSVDEYRALELDRLDTLAGEAWAIMKRTHPKVNNGQVVTYFGDDGTLVTVTDPMPILHAIDRLLAITKRRSELLGLDAPARLDVGGTMRVIVESVDLDKLT